MINIEHKYDCTGCGACEGVCPTGSITMQCDEEGFLYPRVDTSRCIDCSLCDQSCPVVATPLLEGREARAYAVINRDLDTRERSTSGGIFSAIAESVIDRGGVVYGATYDPHWRVVHTKVMSREEIATLRGSKYSQSDMRGVVRDIREELKGGRLVLFSGTSCQADGVRRATSKWRNRIIIVDMICHGVPSPMVFDRYLSEISGGVELQSFTFRSKVGEGASWRESYTRWCVDGVEHMTPERVSDYFYLFLRDLILRPSCYHCPSKGGVSGSDITIADFWGVHRVSPDLDDNRGTSLAIVSSECGATLLKEIADRVELREVDLVAALRRNPSYYKSVVEPTRRRRRVFKEILKGEMLSKIVEQDKKGERGLWRCLQKILSRIMSNFEY